MTEPGDAPDVPDLSVELSREEAIALRESVDAEERGGISHTVAELLDLRGKTNTMAVLSAFAFAEGPLRFSDLETELEVAPNGPGKTTTTKVFATLLSPTAGAVRVNGFGVRPEACKIRESTGHWSLVRPQLPV
ncbi:hypothetical protein SAMN05421752_1192 [Natronorubrum thiooxidans]|uniref:Uncharacterized protein n=1 Tax=Natronorubrum thiooxidans TaxID=308853 RepID=A0A1N7GZK2_9EURY|nr:hypothetical protein SAMN05421752_1192 [Natronorubrum thiooxidans]